MIPGLYFCIPSTQNVPIVDLHCHSTASDGLLPPADLARRAVDNGVEMLALTDHDNIGGLDAARAVAESNGMAFVNGVEISIEWGGLQVHILGYAFDATSAVLNTGLEGIRSGRIERARRMAEALAEVGVDGAFDGAMRFAENSTLISRAHFARYLVEIGVCKDVRSVFESYIVPGKPGYVQHQWVSLAEAVGWIHSAGGVAAIAHPGRYKLSRSQMRQMLDEFKSLGGLALEVVSGSHSADNVSLYGRLAREYGFLASCGSDFHGAGESYVDLGRVAALPAGLAPIWEAF